MVKTSALLVSAIAVIVELTAAFSFFGVKVKVDHQYQWGSVSNVAMKRSPMKTQSAIRLQMAPSYPSVAELFSSPEFSDEEEDDDEEPAQQQPAVIVEGGEPVSPYKEGIQFPTTLNGTDVRVGIIMSRWNADIVQGLYKGINESLTACGVKPSNVFATFVPGAYELPITAKFLAASKRFDVIICVGCLIKGDTMHFEYIAEAAAHGIMNVAIETFTPCLFGVLTVLNKEQAIVRSTGDKNEGEHWGKSAVEMGLARMSAMGAFKQPGTGTDTSPLAGMVTFNSTMPVKPAEKEKAEGGKASKKFGF